MKDQEFLDYYQHFCELTIWFKKIVLHTNNDAEITIKDIAQDFITERNRVLNHVPSDRRRGLRRGLNGIATSYHTKIDKWSPQQRITIDMV